MFKINLHIDKVVVSKLLVPSKKKKKKSKVEVIFEEFNFNKITGENIMIDLKPKQRVRIKPVGLDRKGKVAQVEGATFVSDNEDVATVTVDPADPFAAFVESQEGFGVAIISYGLDDLDADKDADIEGKVTITVTPEEIVSEGELQVGEITDVEESEEPIEPEV